MFSQICVIFGEPHRDIKTVICFDSLSDAAN